ncbi:hypothetical protein M1N08_00790 [Dehalococcoidia bacterium]|nr:hypothetical protein [Dehalococcoidia bacterium]
MLPWWVSLLTGLGAIVVALLTPWIQERLVLRKELAASYLMPFVKWCSTLHEELSEFKDRYIKETNDSTRMAHDSLSHTLIIMDYRELHDRLREAPIYMGKIRKEKPEVARYLQELMELVDRLWHGLHDEFRANFDQSEHDVWYEAIVTFPRKQEFFHSIKDSDISQELWDKFRDKFETIERKERLKLWKKQKKTVKKERIREVLHYLRKQIPSGVAFVFG